MWQLPAWTELASLALPVFLVGMSKGGFPVGAVAVPLLILLWPDQTSSARQAVAFMLPLLCVMDAVAVGFYRRQIRWEAVWPLLPGTLAGVGVASALFVSSEGSVLALSDRTLKGCIGVLGLLFVGYRAVEKWARGRLQVSRPPGVLKGSLFGFGAGLTSTLAHASGPVIQMWLLPQHLPRLQFAGTSAVYFLMLNLIKLVPFAVLGRFDGDILRLGACVLPLLPVGVATGVALVRKTRETWYVGLIYVTLFLASVLLIVKAWV